MRDITPDDVRDVVLRMTDRELKEWLYEGLETLIHILEEDDYFGTEGFNKRFA